MLFTHSVSMVAYPLGSGMTMMGATPWWVAAKASAVLSASPSLDQSAGLPGSPGSNTSVGREGVTLANQAGGRYT